MEMIKDIHGRRTKLLVILAAALTAALGLTVLIGWHTGQTALLRVHPSFIVMRYNTALCFLLCGAGLLFLIFNYRRAAQLCEAVIGVFGALTLAQYLFGVNFGIDQLLMTDYMTERTINPGRMAGNTAVCFFLAGASLLLLSKIVLNPPDICRYPAG